MQTSGDAAAAAAPIPMLNKDALARGVHEKPSGDAISGHLKLRVLFTKRPKAMLPPRREFERALQTKDPGPTRELLHVLGDRDPVLHRLLISHLLSVSTAHVNFAGQRFTNQEMLLYHAYYVAECSQTEAVFRALALGGGSGEEKIVHLHGITGERVEDVEIAERVVEEGLIPQVVDLQTHTLCNFALNCGLRESRHLVVLEAGRRMLEGMPAVAQAANLPEAQIAKMMSFLWRAVSQALSQYDRPYEFIFEGRPMASGDMTLRALALDHGIDTAPIERRTSPWTRPTASELAIRLAVLGGIVFTARCIARRLAPH